MIRGSALATLCCLLVACGAAGDQAMSDACAIDAGTTDSGANDAGFPALRVLFIGNSYT